MKDSLLVVDLGNTDVKFGFFHQTIELIGRGWLELKQCIEENKPIHALISNVSSSENLNEILKFLPHAITFDSIAFKPIVNKYASPETLGQDRLANAVAIKHRVNSGSALSIDLGTCLKFDFVDEYGQYLGGSIAPGMRMRFRALSEFTANLPHIKEWENHVLIGTDTSSSMVSGVIEGMTNEINETISRYLKHYQNLTIFLTGGDSVHFENAIKYPIFADPNLTLHGLKIILEANV